MQSATHVGDEPGPSADAPVPISALAAAAPEALPSKSPQPARSAATTQQGISAAGEFAPDHVDSTTPARSDTSVALLPLDTHNTGKLRIAITTERDAAAAMAAADHLVGSNAQKAASVLAEARRARAAARPPDLDLRLVEEDPFDLHRPLAAATPQRSLDEYQHPWGAVKTPRGLATTPHERSLMTPRRATMLGAGLITPRGGRRRASVSLLSMDVTMMASSACNKPAFETDAHTLMIDALHARVRRLEMQMKVSCMPVARQRRFMLVNAEAHAA